MALNVIRAFRTEHDYVAGGTALNQRWPRLSDDIDIFHDGRERLPQSVEPELQALRDADFTVAIDVETDSTVEAIVSKFGFETKIQWLDDPESCNRFFEAVEDDDLGYRLHQADAAINKVLCASRRRTAARDTVDLMNIATRYAPLGPLIWATAGKDENMNPLTIAQDIRNVAFGYSEEEIRTVRMEDGSEISRDEVRKTLAAALDRATEYCEDVAPEEYVNHLFIDTDDQPIEATDDMLTNGAARAIPIKNFGAISTVRD